MPQVFGRGRNPSGYLSGPEGRGAGRVTVPLLARRGEKSVLGTDWVGDPVRRDLAQVANGVSGHHLLEPRTSGEAFRRFLKRRAFDHLLALALAEITEAGVGRADLQRQRDLLRRKLETMKLGTLGLEGLRAGRLEPKIAKAERARRRSSGRDQC